ncbi:protein kinase [Micromonospora sp. ATCC 39149]|uniref:NACHT domain-containing protein n=1 Tax=Micromonospora carbonacea TaxID=47853 RepID=A0A7D6C5K7_9ACTN|nr:NACHT domain-containing protein [Micromonospora sp. ATCC 39149]EEP72173.1 protein kinase [Micromonospora sp. ATCC 39149]QLJ98364.1 NACHT domain-containing protein [Micromonospora carbonacea]
MRRVATVVLSVVCVTLLGVATNVATGALPARWTPHLWLAWPALVVVVAALTVVEVRRARESAPVTGVTATHARRVLLDRVRRYWITSVLERSLHREARIQLGITASADDRRYPWTLRATHRGGFTGVLDGGASVAGLFERLDRAVVILGAPGSGKTTTLLELARELIDAAERDPDAPIPVVLNLSSWATRRPPLEQWLAAELTERYGIPSRQASAWIESGAILPLLDGLDEVVATRRDECAAAIAAFHARQPLTPIAVCCREWEYRQLRAGLPVYGTVTIQPLTRPQIERYLDRSGPALAGLRAALTADEGLWEFTGSPLLLTIMGLAYADGPGPTAGPGGRRTRLFTRYVETMLRHRPHPTYRPEQAIQYLSVLGHELRRRQQTIFVLDLVASDWSPRWVTPSADLLSRALASVAVGGLVALLGAGLLGWPGLAVGATAGALTALGLALAEYENLVLIASRERRPEDRRPLRVDWVTDTARELRAVAGNTGITWATVAAALVVGLAFGLTDELPGWPGMLAELAYWLGFLLATLLALAVTGATLFDLYLVGPPGGAPRREIPSPALRQRLRSAAMGAPPLGLVTGALAALLVGSARTGADGLRYGAVVGAFAASYLLVAVALGPVTEQWLVRRRLARDGVLPRPLRPFLDYAVQCLFLRDVGDGYIFVHRELLEFFADRLTRPSTQVVPRP